MNNNNVVASYQQETFNHFTHYDASLGAERNSQKWMVRFTFNRRGTRHERIIEGCIAHTLFYLVHKGRHGVTAAEISNWAYPLEECVYMLRNEHNLDITAHSKSHDDSKHTRYELIDAVELLEVNTP